MTMTVLDRAIAAGDAGLVTGEQERPDPEVPQKALADVHREVQAGGTCGAYEAAADGEKGAILRREGLYSSLISE